MYACIYGSDLPDSQRPLLVKCACAFSPKVEVTAPDTVVLDIKGSHRLFGSAREIANEITRHASTLGLRVNLAIASNPDAAFHAARGFSGISIIPVGKEADFLASLPVEIIFPSLAGVDDGRAVEIRQTLKSWGIRCLRDLAALPEAALFERLGAEAVRLQKLAKGASDRPLIHARAGNNFEVSAELEHPVSLFEPLSFILASLLHRLCADLAACSLATNELSIRLKLENHGVYERKLRLPFPMCDSRTFLKLIELEMEHHPPESAIVGIRLAADPAKPRIFQNGLFVPLSPAPQKLELTLARIAKLVGRENIGAAELVDTHRPGAFRIHHFSAALTNPDFKTQPKIRNGSNRVGLRMFRPPLRALVDAPFGPPLRIQTQHLRGQVVASAGPWRTSGEWWTAGLWAQDEWDVQLKDGTLYRLVLDLRSGSWFIEGMYD